MTTEHPSSPILQFDSTFRSNWRQGPPPACKISPKIIKRICDSLNISCKEAAEKELSELQQGALSQTEFTQLIEAVRKSHKVHIEVVGSRGEYFASTDLSVLDEDKLPDAVDRITLDTGFVYRSIFKNDPRNNIRIVFDFRKAPLFDFVSNPSMSTRNDSFIQVTGQSDTWVSGIYESVVSTLKAHSTKRSWLHRQSMYDIFLWLFILPLAFWNLNKLVSTNPTLTENMSSVLLVLGHIYLFVIVLFLFRAFFNYGRWLFPYVELDTPLQSVSAKQRVFFVTLSLGIIGTLLRDFALTLFKLMF